MFNRFKKILIFSILMGLGIAITIRANHNQEFDELFCSTIGFYKKMQITFTNFNKGETLTNFPALLILSNYVGFVNTNGYELRFWTNSTLTGNNLNYEIESFSKTTNSYVWVQVPLLTNNTSVWASWGNSNSTNQQAYTTNGSTWADGSFKGVWHMNNAGNQATDSSTNNNSVGNNGAVGFGATGQVGYATTYNGGSYLSNNTPNDIVNIGMLPTTLSAWVYTSSGGCVMQRINANGGPTYDGGWMVGIDTGLRIRLKIARAVHDLIWNTTPSISAGTWVHVVVYYGGSDGSTDGTKGYINGTLVAGSVVQAAEGSQTTDNYMPFQIGYTPYHFTGANNYFNGGIDEPRIDNGMRSSNWVWACYMNQGTNHNSFVQYGSPTR